MCIHSQRQTGARLHRNGMRFFHYTIQPFTAWMGEWIGRIGRREKQGEGVYARAVVTRPHCRTQSRSNCRQSIQTNRVPSRAGTAVPSAASAVPSVLAMHRSVMRCVDRVCGAMRIKDAVSNGQWWSTMKMEYNVDKKLHPGVAWAAART